MAESRAVSRRIVVGIDGSKSADVALTWAASEAALRGATLHVVHAWQYPAVGELAGLPGAHVGWEDLEAPERDLLDAKVAALATSAPGVTVEASLEHGSAAVALTEAARGADLLVVGSRGRGGFAGLLLGSVSQQCAHHAPCPVVIIPAD